MICLENFLKCFGSAFDSKCYLFFCKHYVAKNDKIVNQRFWFAQYDEIGLTGVTQGMLFLLEPIHPQLEVAAYITTKNNRHESVLFVCSQHTCFCPTVVLSLSNIFDSQKQTFVYVYFAYSDNRHTHTATFSFIYLFLLACVHCTLLNMRLLWLSEQFHARSILIYSQNRSWSHIWDIFLSIDDL